LEECEMERDDFSSDRPTQPNAQQSGAGNTSGFGDAGNTTGSTSYSGTSTGSSTDSQSDRASSVSDRAKNMAGTAKEKLADVGSTARERAGTLKNSLADALETGAEKLRQRGTDGSLAGASGTGSVALESDGRMSDVTSRVATGMQSSADWLRDADLDGLKTGIERQVKEHPGRTLLIAVGIGYLLGKALRK